MLLIPVKYLNYLLLGHVKLDCQSPEVLLIVILYGIVVVLDQPGSEVFIEVI